MNDEEILSLFFQGFTIDRITKMVACEIKAQRKANKKRPPSPLGGGIS